MKKEISFDSLNNKEKIIYELVNKETIKKKFYLIFEEEKENNENKEALIKLLLNGKDAGFSCSSKINSIYERRKDIYKIIIFFVNGNYFDNNDNYIEFKNLISHYQINKLNHLIFFIKDEGAKERLDAFKVIFKLNFEYVYNSEELLKIINNIKNNDYKIDLYKKYNKLILGERLYKFLIEEYLTLFNKSIFGNKKNNYEKYELLFLKISQDIQFFQKFSFDNTISLTEQTKNDIIDIIKNKDILGLIDEFITEKKILTDIDKTLSEFEEAFEEQMKNESNENNNLNDNNDKTNGKNGDNNYKNKIEIKKENSNINNENKNEIIQDYNNIINENKNTMNEIIKEKDSVEKKEEKSENILNKKNHRQGKQIREGKDYQFFVFKNFITENLEEKIKNEILNIVYIILQQSIIHHFEKKFLEDI